MPQNLHGSGVCSVTSLGMASTVTMFHVFKGSNSSAGKR